MWLNITLNEESFKLDSNTVKCLTLVSRYFANALKNYIQQNYWFDLWTKRGRRLTYYSPTKQTQVMDISEIMPSTKKVVFHDHFDDEVDNLLSPHITQIFFGRNFRQKVDHLPLSLTHLRLGSGFNQPIQSLPPNLTHLKFSTCFDQPINNLPSKILRLELGHYYKTPIENPLPPNLTHLKLGFWFNSPIDNILPPSLTHLKVGYFFNQFIQSLPPNVQQVTLGKKFKHPVDHLSKKIKFQKIVFDLNKHVDITTPYQYEP